VDRSKKDSIVVWEVTFTSAVIKENHQNMQQNKYEWIQGFSFV